MAAVDHLKTVVESLSALVEGHLRLFKLELRDDVKGVGMQVGKIVAFLPLLFVGYGFLCGALALLLMRFWPADVACLCVALLNLLGGGLGIAWAARALKSQTLLAGTLHEAAATQTALVQAVKQPTITVQVTHG